MKKVLKQIGKAIGYFAVYLTCMNVVDLIAGFVWGYSKGKEFKEMGLSPDEAAAAFQSVETESGSMFCRTVSAARSVRS